MNGACCKRCEDTGECCSPHLMSGPTDGAAKLIYWGVLAAGAWYLWKTLW